MGRGKLILAHPWSNLASIFFSVFLFAEPENCAILLECIFAKSLRKICTIAELFAAWKLAEETSDKKKMVFKPDY